MIVSSSPKPPPSPDDSTHNPLPAKLAAAALVLLLTLAALVVLRTSGTPGALICFESTSLPSRVPYPRIDWRAVSAIPPSLPSLHSRWIVASLSDPQSLSPSLSRIPGWQLLVVGDSSTPSNWSHPNTIFLPVNDPFILNLRVSHLLPPRSHLRKTAGYLFAIRHGATKILDADALSEIISRDPSRNFVLDLVGNDISAPHPILLQYSHHDPNRSVVNPYIHFGQRSVWPRGMPLENVGYLSAEEFYTEVFSGRQFIQQGLTDGLPDVDSVFYHTRKSELERFDVGFDHEAPMVAVPQGVMVPLNSFNALFDKQAFWGLMLPVSVGVMASDVMRGYWAQRLLWEIGGYVTVCPPTMRRLDRAGWYRFAEERDLHVNVGRLTKFLIAWRSKKHTLFEKILDLSYAMAEEGFWMEEDVRFTAYWLQDLIAVGYLQPRLMSLEIDLPRATIGHGDKKEFHPRQLPTMHLGVEEVGEVSLEINNLIKWRKNFGNVVLILHCSGPPERTALEWRLLYGRIFKTVIILSEEGDANLGVERGSLATAYKNLPEIFHRYAGADGFLFLQDKVILNYWNLLQADKKKLWITNKVSGSWVVVSVTKDSDEWIKTQAAYVKKLVGSLPTRLQGKYKESISEEKFAICGSEIFYLPRKFVGDFHELAMLAKGVDLHHMVAVPLFFMAMDLPKNFDSNALGQSIYKNGIPLNVSYSSYYTTKAPSVYPCNVHSEVDFVKLIRVMASGDPLLMELV